MHDCEMAGLLGRSVAITSMCTTKLEWFDEIRKRGKCNFESEFLEMASHALSFSKK